MREIEHGLVIQQKATPHISYQALEVRMDELGHLKACKHTGSLRYDRRRRFIGPRK